MFYRFEDTIPKNTEQLLENALRRDQRSKELKLAPGIIYKVEIFFPAGCRGLAHLKIRKGGSPVWPTNPDEYFAGDDFPIKFDAHHKVRRGDHWYMDTYNEDFTYPHTVTLRIGILPEYIVAPYLAFSSFVNVLKRLIGLR